MTRRRFFLLLACTTLAACLNSLPFIPGLRTASGEPTARLTDKEFWKIVSDFSESNGFFRSDNLLSNEAWFQYVIPDLTRTAKPGRVYIGVGPEQNFTYIAALKPAMAFIVDIRRGNLDLHLMYKALFELSADRVEFVSRLFSRKPPHGLDEASTAGEIFAAYSNVDPNPALYSENMKAIEYHLLAEHGFTLSPEDLTGIKRVYQAFVLFGPGIRYSSTGSFGGDFQPTYADLMAAMDTDGQTHGYLSSEEAFRFVKDFESRNLLVPLVGNFAGPKTIRAVASYLKEKEATVSAFYLSNVEQYLKQDGTWGDFCANVATLPLDETSTFIRSMRGGGFGLNSKLGAMANDVKDCGANRQ